MDSFSGTFFLRWYAWTNFLIFPVLEMSQKIRQFTGKTVFEKKLDFVKLAQAYRLKKNVPGKLSLEHTNLCYLRLSVRKKTTRGSARTFEFFEVGFVELRAVSLESIVDFSPQMTRGRLHSTEHLKSCFR